MNQIPSNRAAIMRAIWAQPALDPHSSDYDPAMELRAGWVEDFLRAAVAGGAAVDMMAPSLTRRAAKERIRVHVPGRNIAAYVYPATGRVKIRLDREDAAATHAGAEHVTLRDVRPDDEFGVRVSLFSAGAVQAALELTRRSIASTSR